MLEIASLSQFQNCATIPISVTGPLFLNILDPPLLTTWATETTSIVRLSEFYPRDRGRLRRSGRSLSSGQCFHMIASIASEPERA